MKLGLALGGGGGRGAAVIGVLTELQRIEVNPHLITGTSIGGLLGALFAAGGLSYCPKSVYTKTLCPFG